MGGGVETELLADSDTPALALPLTSLRSALLNGDKEFQLPNVKWQKSGTVAWRIKVDNGASPVCLLKDK